MHLETAKEITLRLLVELIERGKWRLGINLAVPCLFRLLAILVARHAASSVYMHAV